MNNKYKVLIIDTDESSSSYLVSLFKKNDYLVVDAKGYGDAGTMYTSHVPDIVIISSDFLTDDVGLFIKNIRETCLTPIIVLSKQSDVCEKVKILDLGANDYIIKPFNIDELMARVRVALRFCRYIHENNSALSDRFVLGELKIDYDTRQVFIGNKKIKLTRFEYNILSILSSNYGRVVPYSDLIKGVWNEYSSYSSIKKLQVNIANVKKKIDTASGGVKYIFNEAGIGYRIDKEI